MLLLMYTNILLVHHNQRHTPSNPIMDGSWLIWQLIPRRNPLIIISKADVLLSLTFVNSASISFRPSTICAGTVLVQAPLMNVTCTFGSVPVHTTL